VCLGKRTKGKGIEKNTQSTSCDEGDAAGAILSSDRCDAVKWHLNNLEMVKIVLIGINMLHATVYVLWAIFNFVTLK
jgi:hypothetical protein